MLNGACMKREKRVIAIYLPQYHPFKENDEWWGKGFTEWTNVAKARPLFYGHYQPHIPADLGFYDLRLSEVREAQASLAKCYGIYGFCYYHYWFNGHRLMNKPIDEMLSSRKPDFPFMFCWANENWTRVWDGSEKQILIRQNYSEEDDIRHINWLLDNVFCDPRYIRIDEKPVFAVYRSTLFPDMKKTIQLWRTEAKKRGVELYLCRVESFNTKGADYLNVGFDASIAFPPHNIKSIKESYDPFNWLIKEYFSKFLKIKVFKYERYVNEIIKEEVDYKRYNCVTPMWDNSSRKRKCLVLVGSRPDLYYKLLKVLLEKFEPYSKEENLFFINAWNEWAEGNHLEPDLRWGRKYLEATKAAIEEAK